MKKTVTVLVTAILLFTSVCTANVSALYYNRSFVLSAAGRDLNIAWYAPQLQQAQQPATQNTTTQQSEQDKSYQKSTVVAVMYHKISENPAEIGDFCISPETFEQDIIWFVDNGYSFCFASEVDEILAKELPVAKYAVITFDDGYESDYRYALPILEKYNAQATFFVIGTGIGENDRISEESLKLMAQSPLVEIGTHSYELHNLSVDEMRKSYSANKISYIVGDFKKGEATLEEITGKDVRTLSFPNGIWSVATVTELRKVGFEELFSSELKRIEFTRDRYGRVNRYNGADIATVLANYIS